MENALGLNHQYLNDTAIYNLTRSLPQGVTSLDISHNQIGENGMEALATILPCTQISSIDITNNALNATKINYLAQLNELKIMCETQRCYDIWSDETICIVPKPASITAFSDTNFVCSFFALLSDKTCQLIDYTLKSLCDLLGNYAQDVVASCPSYFTNVTPRNSSIRTPITSSQLNFNFFSNNSTCALVSAPIQRSNNTKVSAFSLGPP